MNQVTSQASQGAGRATQVTRHAVRSAAAILLAARIAPLVVGLVAAIGLGVFGAPVAVVVVTGAAALALAAAGQWLATRAVAARLGSVAALVRGLGSQDSEPPALPPGPLYRPLYQELLVLDSELRRRESSRRQSEEVLRLVVNEAPSAIVFMTASGHILLANARARALFFDGVDLVGKNFLTMLSRAPDALKRAMTGEGDELLSIEDADGEPRTFHLAKRHLVLDGDPVVLVTVNDLTRELGRREIEVWKQVIRVIAHEVHNSLAPISTLATTGRVLVAGSENIGKLERVFDTVKERSNHLREFLDGYARLARLPAPVPRQVVLAGFAERMESLVPGIRVEGDLAGQSGWFDPAQIEQLLLNLLKNAGEADSPREQISLVVDAGDPRFIRFAVRDRGHGMPPDVMKRALLPLFSTKSGGAGLGLTLCREIADAHGGNLRIVPRDGGGVEVSVKLPRRAAALATRPSPLTLTRGE